MSAQNKGQIAAEEETKAPGLVRQDSDLLAVPASPGLPRSRRPSFSGGLEKVLQQTNFLTTAAVGKLSRKLSDLAPQVLALRSGSTAAERLAYPNAETLAHKYSRAEHDVDAVFAVAAHIIATDARFSAKDPALAPIVAMARALTDTEKNFYSKVKHNMTQDLVGLKTRARQTLRLGFPRVTGTYTQAFGAIGAGAVPGAPVVPIADRTLSSDAIKKDQAEGNAFMRQNNANLGAVHGPDGLLLVRSARTDTPKRLEELLIFGAVQSGPQKVPYRAAIVSAMDLSPLKEAATRLAGGEVETDFLKQQQAAVTELFGDATQIQRAVQGVGVVQLQRPLMFNLVFSGQAKDEKNILAARHYNKPALVALMPDFAAQLTHTPQARALAESVVTATQESQQHALLSSRQVAQWVADPTDPLGPKARLALTALKLGITGSDFAGNTYTRPDDPALELALMQHLLQACHVTPHVQCKSGEDRTLSMVGMLVAADDYSRTAGAPFDPAALRDSTLVHRDIREAFTAASNAFGHDPIKDVRGVDGRAKWGVVRAGEASHPVPASMYLPEGSRIGQGGKS